MRLYEQGKSYSFDKAVDRDKVSYLSLAAKLKITPQESLALEERAERRARVQARLSQLDHDKDLRSKLESMQLETKYKVSMQ